MDDSRIIIIGANGQLGQALQEQYPGARTTDIDELDITNPESVTSFDWSNVDIILNAAAYTNVDGAETPAGRIAAWKVNATAVGYLAAVATDHDLLLVHISSDYVFDGTQTEHLETEDLSPLSVYGASKAAGDLLAAETPRHYILRTSWVIGDGKNFVRTMLDLGKRGISPSVVSDQIGRLTFTSELVRAIDHCLTKEVDYGLMNVSNSGPAVSWAEVTRAVFEVADYALTVTDVTTAEYYEGKLGIAPRPLLSSLCLDKLKSTGFESVDWKVALLDYINKEQSS